MAKIPSIRERAMLATVSIRCWRGHKTDRKTTDEIHVAHNAKASSGRYNKHCLDKADLAVVFLRFQNFPPEQMSHFAAYLDRGGPVIGLRTATHAFKIPAAGEFKKFSYENPVRPGI